MLLYLYQRFIPAYAGNSAKKNPQIGAYPVHPRLRGELHISSLETYQKRGSSPLTRGTRNPRFKNSLRMRFIPAYAGNSDSVSPQSNLSAVHPRLRGELAQKTRNRPCN